MHFPLIGLIYFSSLYSLGFSTPIFGDECKVHIDNRHSEIKDLVTSHQRFNVNNWSHIVLLFIIGLLLSLLILAYCFIKLKIWPSIKQTHTHPTSFSAPRYIINPREQPTPTAVRLE